MKRLSRISTIIDQFWNRWKHEYLTSLREFHQRPGKDSVVVKVGDVVLVHDEKPRNQWNTGIVEQLNHGNDGLVRSAIIRTKSGCTSRPIVKLYPLEITDTAIQDGTTDERDNKDNDQEPGPSR